MKLFAGTVTVGAMFLGAAAHATMVEGTATVDGKPASHAVVYLENAGTAPIAVPLSPVVMDQKNLAFVPDVLPVRRGTVIEFTNSDDVQHNVFSPSAIAAKFNLGTYGPGATRTLTFNEPGDVLVLCNIHMEMAAHILVLNDPYFSTVTEGGHYRIPNVPKGTYHVKIWQERWLPFTQTIDVEGTETRTINITAGK